jgi:hypothetical protein
MLLVGAQFQAGAHAVQQVGIGTQHRLADAQARRIFIVASLAQAAVKEAAAGVGINGAHVQQAAPLNVLRTGGRHHQRQQERNCA